MQHYWTIDGYGLAVDPVSYTPNGVIALAAMVPDIKAYLDEGIKECQKGKPHAVTEEEINEFMDDYETKSGIHGLAAVLADVMNELEPVVKVTPCENYDNEQFVLYEPNFPWHMSEKEKTLSCEELDSIFKKYLDILTEGHGDAYPCSVISVENNT